MYSVFLYHLHMKDKLWITITCCLAYCIDKELYKAIDYLKEQVHVLLEQQGGDKRLLLNNHQRFRLARKAKELNRGMLDYTTVLFTPATVLGWYRKLISQKYTSSKNPGRPSVAIEIKNLVLKLRNENPRWGAKRITDVINSLDYDVSRTTVRNILIQNGFNPEPDKMPTWKDFIKTHFDIMAATDFFSVEILTPKGLVRHLVLFAIDLSTRKVEILGVRHDPNGQWMAQVARNMSDCESGFLKHKKYLIHDRDSLFTAQFTEILNSANIECIKLPPKSPNLNAYAERFVRTIKEECLNHLILTSEKQLRYVLDEFLEYYHTGRIHQSLGQIIEPQHCGNTGEIFCIERLGGLLKSYHRNAA